MKYIRTKDGIYEVDKKHSDNEWIEVKLGNGWNYHLLSSDIKDQADTIEELIMPNDLLFFGDDNGNKIPFYVENISWLNAWARTHDIYKITELYIKVGNDYKCVARLNNKGKLELL